MVRPRVLSMEMIISLYITYYRLYIIYYLLHTICCVIYTIYL